MAQYPRLLELLAPAKDLDTAIAAIDCGADAVYMGAARFGARSAAGNSVDDIKRAVEYSHRFNAKVYVTVNTIIKDDELVPVRDLICQLYEIGVDALIVQDMGILMMDIPPIELHASTQCDISSVEKARFLESVGFSQLVLARELSIDEIKSVADNVSVPIEAFVHGALCVSYSGKCHASCVFKSRSANRGECAQMCRLAYDLIDGNNRVVATQKHLLSLRDMNRLNDLQAMADAGVSSFKIEGRLKEMPYVKNVVTAYRRELDRIISNSEGRYQRPSYGMSETGFIPDLCKSFNRGFTNYFLTDTHPAKGKLASFYTPKSKGEPFGTVASVDGNVIYVKSDKELHNGDGISFFNPLGIYEGVRVNKVVPGGFVAFEKTSLRKGMQLYRTFDKSFNDELGVPVKRSIGVNFLLSDDSLTAVDEIGNKSVVPFEKQYDVAKNDQSSKQRELLSKLGNTNYRAVEIKITTNIFIPLSSLADMRRACIDILLSKQQEVAFMRTRNKRRKEAQNLGTLPFKKVTYLDNVANELAKEFYTNHGIEVVESALEVCESLDTRSRLVMTSRYCLRREMGACLKYAGSDKLIEPLTLKANDGTKLHLKFDCAHCRMKVYS